MNEKRIVRFSAEEIRDRVARGKSRTDWARVDAMTDDEIAARMRDDADWAEFIDIDWSKADLVIPVLKDPISIRLDKGVLDFFRATGKCYQTRINAVLRHYMEEALKKRAG